MAKIFKKSLALVVTVAICLSAFVGCLSALADGEAVSFAADKAANEMAVYNTALMEVNGNNLRAKANTWNTSDASTLQTYDDLVANGFTNKDAMPYVTYYVDAPEAGSYGFKMWGWYWGYGDNDAYKVISVNNETFIKSATGTGRDSFYAEDGNDYFMLDLNKGVNAITIIFYTADKMEAVNKYDADNNRLETYAFDDRLTVITMGASKNAKDTAYYNDALMQIDGNNVRAINNAWNTSDASTLQTYDDIIVNGFTNTDTMPYVTYYVDAPAAGGYLFEIYGWYWGYGDNDAYKVISVNNETFIKSATGAGRDSFKPANGNDYFYLDLKEGVNAITIIFYTADKMEAVNKYDGANNRLETYAFDSRLTVVEEPEPEPEIEFTTYPAADNAEYDDAYFDVSGTNLAQKANTWPKSGIQTYDEIVANGLTSDIPSITYYVNAPAAGTYGFQMSGYFWGYGGFDENSFKVVSVNDETFIKSGIGYNTFEPAEGEYFELELKEGENFIRVLMYTADCADYIVPDNAGNNSFYYASIDTRLTVVEPPYQVEFTTYPAADNAEYDDAYFDVSGTDLVQKANTWPKSGIQTYDEIVANGLTSDIPSITYYVNAPAAGTYGFQMSGWLWGYGGFDENSFKVVSVNDETFIKSGIGYNTFEPAEGDYFELELKEGENFIRVLMYTADCADYIVPDNAGNNSFYSASIDTRLTVVEPPYQVEFTTYPAANNAEYDDAYFDVSGTDLAQKANTWPKSGIQTYDEIVANGLTSDIPSITYYVNAPAAGTYGFQMSGYFWGYGGFDENSFKVVSVNDETFIKSGIGYNTFEPAEGDYFELELKEGENFIRVLMYTADCADYIVPDNAGNNSFYSASIDTRLTVVEPPYQVEFTTYPAANNAEYDDVYFDVSGTDLAQKANTWPKSGIQTYDDIVANGLTSDIPSITYYVNAPAAGTYGFQMSGYFWGYGGFDENSFKVVSVNDETFIKSGIGYNTFEPAEGDYFELELKEGENFIRVLMYTADCAEYIVPDNAGNNNFYYASIDTRLTVVEPPHTCEFVNPVFEVVDGNCVTTYTCECGETKVFTVANTDIVFSPILEADLSVGASIANDAIAGYTNVYAGFSKEAIAEGESDAEQTITAYAATSDGNGIEFTYAGIYAKQMRNNIDARIYATNEEGYVVLLAQEDWSMYTYINGMYDMLKDFIPYKDVAGYESYANLGILMVDLANYGAKAQQTFSYNVENLANDYVDTTLGTALEDLSGVTGEETGIKITCSPLLENKIEVELSVKIDDLLGAASYLDIYGGKVEIAYSDPITGEPTTRVITMDNYGDENYFYDEESGTITAVFSDYVAKTLCDDITIRIIKGDGTVIASRVFGIAQYAAAAKAAAEQYRGYAAAYPDYADTYLAAAETYEATYAMAQQIYAYGKGAAAAFAS